MNMENKRKYEVFRLGKDNRCMLDTDTVATRRNNNILVIGGTGTGKTSGVSNNMILGLENSNAVVVFTKQGEMDTFSRILKGKGYNVHKIDFTKIDKNGYGYDPLAACTGDDDIENLAQSIVYSDTAGRMGKDPYWEDTAKNLLNVILKYVKYGHYDKGKNMKAVLELMNGFHWRFKNDEGKISEINDDEYEDNEEYIAKLKEDHPLHFEMENLKKYSPADAAVWENFDQLSNTTGGCVVSTLSTAFNRVFKSNIRKIVSKDKLFDFKQLLKPKTVLFLKMSPVNSEQNSFIGILYSQLFKNLFELAEKQPGEVLPYPVHVICDDFATGCHVNKFEEQISVFREKRISATMLIQSESQLRSIYGGDDATTIINNCDTIIYLGGMDLETARDVSLRLNKPLEDVLYMKIGREYYFRRGEKPIITESLNYWNNPEYVKYKKKAPSLSVTA